MRMIKADDLAQQMIAHRVASPVKKSKIGEFESMFGVPVVDAEEVVRCKNCKHWALYPSIGCTEHVKVCDYANWMVGENGFCVYGERVTNAAD